MDALRVNRKLEMFFRIKAHTGGLKQAKEGDDSGCWKKYQSTMWFSSTRFRMARGVLHSRKINTIANRILEKKNLKHF
jgi:hypothetical protein